MWSIDLRDHARLGGGDSVFVRIADAVAADIRRGVLRAGDCLPSTRALAGDLAVNRNTVVAAYDELVAQGWAVSRGPAGTFVADDLPDRRPISPRPANANANVNVNVNVNGLPRRPAYAFPAITAPITPIVTPSPADATSGIRFAISAGVPDPRLFPRTAFARAYRRALRSRASTTALGYGDPRGTQALRSAIAAMLRDRRAMPVGPEHVLVTRGSQMALDLIARLLVRPGDIAAVEALGYQPAWRAFEAAGAALAGVPLDEHGVIVDAIPRAARLLYTTPHHQYPTTVLLPQPRRLALLARAREQRLAIVEDDYDHEFHFDGRPVAPLASADPSGNVLYVGSLAKILAPGLRLGFVVAPEPVIAALAAIRAAVDRQGDHVLELAVAELIDDGEVHRHAHKQRRAYASRRDALATALAKHLGGALTFALPAGGITLWARVAPDIALDTWRERAHARGVAFAIARDFALDRKPRPFARLAFARHDEAELREIAKLLAAALP